MTLRYLTHDPRPEPDDCIAPDIDMPDWFTLGPDEPVMCGTCGRQLDVVAREAAKG